MQTRTKLRLLQLYRYLCKTNPNPKFRKDKQGRWVLYVKCGCGKPLRRRAAEINKGGYSIIMCKRCSEKFWVYLKNGVHL